jgi:hypothetical protein
MKNKTLQKIKYYSLEKLKSKDTFLKNVKTLISPKRWFSNLMSGYF